MLTFLRTTNRHLMVSLSFGAVLLLTLFVLCFQFSANDQNSRAEIAINLAVFVAGWSSGWVVGTLVAPYDEGEARLFSRISKVIWAFASGYLFGKLDPIFSSLRESQMLPLSEITVFRLIVFLSVTVIVMMIVFMARKYGRWHVSEAEERVPHPAP
jgi:hypothetical protein